MTDLLEPPRALAAPSSPRRAFADPPRELPRPEPVLGDLPSPVLTELPAPEPADQFDAPTPTPTPRRGRPDGSNRRALLIVELVAIAAVVAAAVIAMFWSSALGQRNDALAARDVAVAQRDASTRIAEAAVADRATAEAELRAATAEIDRLEGEIVANEAAVADLEEQIAGLDAQMTELTEANAALGARVEELDALVAEAPAAPAADLTATELPEFSRFIGEQLTAAGGADLTADQQRCLGATVVATTGLDGYAAGAAAASPEAELALAIAIGDAADSCGIDRALVFG